MTLGWLNDNTIWADHLLKLYQNIMTILENDIFFKDCISVHKTNHCDPLQFWTPLT